MASLYVVTDKPEVAARLIGCSDAIHNEIGDPRPRIEQADLDGDIAAIKANIGTLTRLSSSFYYTLLDEPLH